MRTDELQVPVRATVKCMYNDDGYCKIFKEDCNKVDYCPVRSLARIFDEDLDEEAQQ
jgi:hypothetical protein